ncbi:hypothetical protein [Alcaligenes endophyticus]|uniref:DUF3318 domain-containing protein n=1 Tax=Alcaligenes endophyticus TaxID=1929088 RepID=A0ABT8EGX4_9BURK|nr:hypothetical protein [Alcaligenes endophyticus]MCX5589804.1 hypothetical protein [Alcaligenes endophyticus]MDN4120533.1 hypothetical protein [Alcaligenes endophyticus]
MSRHAKAQNRAIRIELLRARAAVERQALCQQSQDLAQDLQPRNLLNSFTPAFTAHNMSNWVGSAMRLSRRYPFLLSGASTVLSMFGGRWVKFAAAGLVGWKLFSNYQDRRQFQPENEQALAEHRKERVY